ncbi:hypothetical protein LJC22_02450 [Desulfosarcina sp. OttesenSCG-928-G10]|nr:hypothetical protein [Desulfosarcina sp. OttesenSCG-928-G10]
MDKKAPLEAKQAESVHDETVTVLMKPWRNRTLVFTTTLRSQKKYQQDPSGCRFTTTVSMALQCFHGARPLPPGTRDTRLTHKSSDSIRMGHPP